MSVPVPEAALNDGGWTHAKTRSRTVFEGVGVSVRAETAIYEDADLRERIAAAGGPDRVWRFFFSSRLAVSPSPPLLETVGRPHAVRESKQDFADELRDRGIEAVSAGDTRSVRVADAEAALTPFYGTVDADRATVDVVGALALWYDNGFCVAGGMYPSDGVERWVDVAPDAFETELLSLIRATAETAQT